MFKKIISKNEIKNLLKFLVVISIYCIIDWVIKRYSTVTSPLYALYFILIFIVTSFYGLFGGIIITFIIFITHLPVFNLYSDFISYQLLFTQFIVLNLAVLFFSTLFSNKKELNKYSENRNLKIFSSIQDLILNLQKKIKKNDDFSLIFINIKNYEDISIFYEQNELDDIICNLFTHLKKNLKNSEIYSYSYNKFIILMNKKESNLKSLFLKYISALNNSTLINKNLIKTIIKIGIVEGPLQNKSPNEIIYLARVTSDQGSNYKSDVYEYDSKLIEKRKESFKLAIDLSKALKENKLFFVYQPIINANTGTVDSCELLIRWINEENKFVSPEKFIKIAEDYGFINDITKYLIKSLIENYKIWEQNGVVLNQSINITSEEIIDNNFMIEIKDQLVENNIPIDKIGLELTERSFCSDNIKLKKNLILLQNLGFKVEIDDFGMEYNSLSTLNNFSCDIIKIDKSFVDKIDESSTKTIMKYTIKTAHEMGKLIIAEGVETLYQYNELLELDCDYIQGYFFSKPLTSNDFIDFYKNFNYERIMFAENELLLKDKEDV